MEEYVWLTVWLIGLFGLVGAAVYWIYRGVRADSTVYDEAHVWLSPKPVEPEHSAAVKPSRNR